MKIKKYLDKILIKTFKKKKDESWLSFYSEETKAIKFSDKSIYNYLRDEIGDDLDLYALNYFGTRITYNEMFKRIESISRSLKHLGVKKGDIVTICLPNMPEAVEIFYAINKIGAVADMIHPLSSATEIKHYLKESKSRILFLYNANYEKVKNFIDETYVNRTILIGVDESMPTLLGLGYKLMQGLKIKKPQNWKQNILNWQEFLNLSHIYRKKENIKINAKDLAIILHSGGTTGTPKGIMISNYNFNAIARQGAVNVTKVRPMDKIMTILPLFHGFGLGICVHCPLCLGVEVILIPEFDGKRFSKIIKKYNPQVLAGVPTLWEGILTNKYFEDINLSSLKYIISGGDHLTTTMEEKINTFLREHGAKIIMSKGYGMTESVAATIFTFEHANEPGSVGIPMIGNTVKICGINSIKEVEPGIEGEICVSGPTIMMGYYNNKEETKKVLKRHDDGKTYLHTGDIGYINQNGVIYFTQRLKRIIVSSGFNLYPSIIEEVIERHPKVKKCCVIGIPHDYKMHVAKALVVLNDNATPNIKIQAEIRLLCKKELAAYSQPKEIEFVTHLPETLYKKIDYKRLEQEEQEKYEKKKKQATRMGI